MGNEFGLTPATNRRQISAAIERRSGFLARASNEQVISTNLDIRWCERTWMCSDCPEESAKFRVYSIIERYLPQQFKLPNLP